MFNSDQLEDFICYTAKEGLIQLYFASNDMMSERVSWKGTATACNNAAMENVFINDVNGDKLDDLVCRNPTTRNIEVFVNKGGYFGSNSDWSGQMGFCQNEKDILNVYDMNGDGKGDLICGDQENAAKLLVVFQALE